MVATAAKALFGVLILINFLKLNLLSMNLLTVEIKRKNNFFEQILLHLMICLS
jgi:hypothetical protein